MKTFVLLILTIFLTPLLGYADQNAPNQTSKAQLHTKGQGVTVPYRRLVFPTQKSAVPEPIISSEPIMSSQQNSIPTTAPDNL